MLNSRSESSSQANTKKNIEIIENKPLCQKLQAIKRLYNNYFFLNKLRMNRSVNEIGDWMLNNLLTVYLTNNFIFLYFIAN